MPILFHSISLKSWTIQARLTHRPLHFTVTQLNWLTWRRIKCHFLNFLPKKSLISWIIIGVDVRWVWLWIHGLAWTKWYAWMLRKVGPLRRTNVSLKDESSGPVVLLPLVVPYGYGYGATKTAVSTSYTSFMFT